MKLAATFLSLLHILFLLASCSDKKLMANNGGIGRDIIVPDSGKAVSKVSVQPDHKSKMVDDTLQFKEKLELTIFNRNINKYLLSRHVSTGTARFPAGVLEELAKVFYRNLQESGNESYFIEKGLSINDVQMYETTNHWNIYFIFLGSEYETKGYIAGCFNQDNKNYVLKDVFGEPCATYTFRAPNLLENGLSFSVYENYSCQDGQEEIYNNTFAVTPDTLLHERKTLTPKEVMELFALSN